MIIWIVAKDPGGTTGVIPIVQNLRIIGQRVYFFANVEIVKIISPEEKVYKLQTVQNLLRKYPLPKIFITSMCSDGGVGLDLIPILKRKGIPTIAIQDFWGQRLWTSWAGLQNRPDFIFVNDAIGAEIVTRAWPEYDSERIKVVGYPAMDKYIDCDFQDLTSKLKSELKLNTNKPIIFYAGQLARSGDVLFELIESLNKLKQNVYLIPRMHYLMKEKASEELTKWYKALDLFKSGELIANPSIYGDKEFVVLSTVIVSVFSTVLIEAAVLRKQNISILYPEVGMALFQESTGGEVKEFPLVKVGSSAKASNRQMLCNLLEKSFKNNLGLEKAQNKFYTLEHNNSRRIANLIVRIV